MNIHIFGIFKLIMADIIKIFDIFMSWLIFPVFIKILLLPP